MCCGDSIHGANMEIGLGRREKISFNFFSPVFKTSAEAGLRGCEARDLHQQGQSEWQVPQMAVRSQRTSLLSSSLRMIYVLPTH
jgi:hypothetical protein